MPFNYARIMVFVGIKRQTQWPNSLRSKSRSHKSSTVKLRQISAVADLFGASYKFQDISYRPPSYSSIG